MAFTHAPWRSPEALEFWLHPQGYLFIRLSLPAAITSASSDSVSLSSFLLVSLAMTVSTEGKWEQKRHVVSGLLNDTFFAHTSVSSSLVQPWVICSQEVHWIWNCVHKGKLTNLTHWLPNWLMTVLQGSLGDCQPVSLVITCTPFCIYLCAELLY